MCVPIKFETSSLKTPRVVENEIRDNLSHHHNASPPVNVPGSG